MLHQINQVLLICALVVIIDCFPDGGPADTCVKPERFNQPNHGKARTQSLGSLPYEVIATTDQYQPGQQIPGRNCIKLLSMQLNIYVNVNVNTNFFFIDGPEQLPFVVMSIFVDFSYKPEMLRQMNGLVHGKIAKIQKPFQNVHQ